MFNDSSNARTSRDCGMSQRTVLSAHSPFLAMEEALKFSSASSRKAFILLWQTKRDIALSALRRIHLGLRKYHKMITIRSIVARTRHFLKLYFPLGFRNQRFVRPTKHCSTAHRPYLPGNWFHKQERDMSQSICPIVSPSTGSLHSPGDLQPHSISPCRTASRMPTLQLHHSFTRSNYTSTLDGCSTPYTPLNQILRTPPYPPQLQHIAIKRTPARPRFVTFVCPHSVEDSTTVSKSSRAYLNRRLSTVAPPEAIPIRAPRRLSYSHLNYANFSRSCSGVFDASNPENSFSSASADLLASPVTLRSASSLCRSPAEVIGERTCRKILAS